MSLPFPIKRNILEHPNRCPYCRSEHLDADSPTIEYNDDIYVNVTCTNCNKKWVEIYRLVSAEDD